MIYYWEKGKFGYRKKKNGKFFFNYSGFGCLVHFVIVYKLLVEFGKKTLLALKIL